MLSSSHKHQYYGNPSRGRQTPLIAFPAPLNTTTEMNNNKVTIYINCDNNTGRVCSVLVLICCYNPPLTPAKQLECPGHSEPSTACKQGCLQQTGTHTRCAQLTNFGSVLNVREVEMEGVQRVKRKAGRKGSRRESLWGGGSADEPGSDGQGEGASASTTPSLLPSHYT